ncbi:MAG: hypothetical protein JOZ51_23280 [Chloroflexi bacterium]|nr:hypothetical protein [Chloroflexota bacterium]
MATNIFRKRLNVLLVLLTLGVGFASTYVAHAAGETPDKGERSKHDRRHEQVGTWFCSGVTTPANGQQRPYYGMFKNEWALDGSWLLIHFEELQSPTGTPLIEDQYWGFDAATNKHSRTLMANDGSHAAVRSQGWNKDQLPWSGTFTAGETTFEYQETTVRHSANRYRWYGSVTGQSMTVVSYDITCNRSK